MPLKCTAKEETALLTQFLKTQASDRELKATGRTVRFPPRYSHRLLHCLGTTGASKRSTAEVRLIAIKTL